MQSLLRLVGLDMEECRGRMRYLGIDERDRRLLAEACPALERVADEMLDRFYEHLLAFEQTAEFLRDPHTVRRLKAMQREHFLRLCSGPYDEDYFESRLRVGFAHARIQLEPHWYLGAYLVQLEFLQAKLKVLFPEDPSRVADTVRALWKLVMLDIALATDSYIYGGFVERSLAEAHAFAAENARAALEDKQREETRREELLSMVVHDVRSPVTAMIATARVGLRRFRDHTEPPGKQFELIENAGHNVLRIIDSVVAHARAPGGELPAKREAVDVADIVRHCVEQLQPFANQTGHIVTLEDVPPLRAEALDAVLVRRVIANLVMNACRHTPAGSHVIVDGVADEVRIVVRVADDGPGVPAAIRSTLFEPKRARGRRGSTYVDSGLGLPFCKMACERMGGTIELLATSGRGAIFVVTLPASSGEPPGHVSRE